MDWQAIVDNQTELICRYDTNFNLTFVNRAYADWLNTSPTALLGANILDRIPRADRRRAVAKVRALTPETPVAVSIHPSILPNGSQRLIEWTDLALFDPNGGFIEYQGVGRDVSLREQQAQQLRQLTADLQTQHQQVNEILHTTQDALLSINLPNREVVFVSANYAAIMGHPVERFRTDPNFFQTVVHPADLPAAQAAMRTCLNTGYVELDHRIIWPTGEVRWLHRRAWVNYDATGNPIRVNDSARDITARKQAEDAAHLFQSAVEQSTEAVIITNPAIEIISVNPAFTAITGYTAADVLGRTPLNFLSAPEDTATLQQLMGDLAGGRPFTGETAAHHKSGQPLYIRWSTAPIRDADGQLTHFVTILSDITASKLAEQRLHSYKNIVNSTPDGIALVDHNFTYQVVNHTYLTRTDKAASDIEHHPVAEIMGAEAFAKLIRPNFERCLAGETIQYADWFDYPTLGRRYVNVTYSPYIDTTGATTGIVVNSRDITDQKLAEDALHASRGQLDALIDSQTNYVIRTDLAGHYTYWNKKFAEQFGWLYPAGLAGQLSLTGICPHHHQRTHEVVEQCIAHPGQVVVAELDKPAPDGSVRNTIWEFVCLTDATGQPSELQCMGIEITDLKASQAEVQYQAGLLQQVSDAIIATDLDLRITSWNAAASEIYGYSEAKALGQVVDQLLNTQWPPDAQAAAQQSIAATSEWRGEVRQQTQAGQWRDIFSAVSTVTDSAGQPIGLVGINRDISDRKRRETLQRRMTGIMEGVAEGRPLPTLLYALTHAIEEYEPAVRASVLLLDAATGQLRHGIAPSLPAEYCNAIDGLVIGAGVGSCGTAAFEKRLVIVEDIATHPYWKPFLALALPHNLRACWSQPIFSDADTVLGTFALYYDHPHAPTDAELEIIQLAAHIASVAIRRTHSEQTLRAREEQYRSLVESSDAAISMVNAEGVYLYLNAIAAAPYRTPPEALVGKTVHDLFPPAEADQIIANVHRVITTQTGMVLEPSVTLAGETRWFRTSIQPVRDAAGQPFAAMIHATEITDKKRAERDLLIQNAILHQSEAFIGLADLNGIALFINQGGAKMLRAPDPAALVGRSIADFHPPDIAGRILAEYMPQVAATGEWRGETRLRCFDGTEIPVEQIIFAIRDASGAAVRLATILTDISDRKRAEDELRTQNEILRQSRDLIALADETGIVRFINHGGATLLGGSDPAEFIGRPLADFHHPVDSQRVFQQGIPQAVATGLWRAENTVVTAQGTAIPVAQTIFPIRDAAGNILNFATIISDITERKRAEDALRTSEEQYRSLVESSEAAIAMFNATGHLLYANEISAGQLGRPVAELLGQPMHSLFPTAIANYQLGSIQQVIATGVGMVNEAPSVVANNEERWFRTSIQPVRGAAGHIDAALIHATDITRFKRAEADLRHSEDLFRRFMNNLTGTIFILDADGRLQFANPQYAANFNQRIEDMLGQHLSDYASPELAALALQENQSVLAAPETSLEFTYTDNTFPDYPRYWRIIKFAIPQNGAHSLIGAVGLDVTAEKLAEEALRAAYNATLEGWVHALDMRDNETEGHSRRVTELTVAVARHAGFSDADLEHIRRGALLHDIGKMAIPDAILRKPGPLTNGEWTIMKQHPVYAYHWLRGIDYLIPALDIPHYHHERWDGSGYPAGLAGDGIPLPARIFAIIDVWDALTSDRPYRKAWSVEKTTAYLREQAGSHFDPNLVDLFLRLLADGQLPHASTNHAD